MGLKALNVLENGHKKKMQDDKMAKLQIKTMRWFIMKQ